MPASVATSTVTGLLDSLFQQSLSFLIYVVELTWPYLLAIAFVGIAISIGKRIFHQHK